MNQRDTETQRVELPARLNNVSGAIVDAAYLVHKSLGPGLLEYIYEECLAHELAIQGLRVQRQVSLPILYRDLEIASGLRLDMVVEDSVIVELKAVERLLPVHEAQLLTYLKLSTYRLGLLINFNVPLIRDGIKRRVL